MTTSTAIPELGNRTWEELEVMDHSDGHLLFKDFLRKKTAKGAFVLVEVRVRVVRMLEVAKARAECREWFRELKLDEDKDRDIFVELEQLCILAHAIRTKDAPHPQFATAQELAEQFDEASLMDLLGRIEEIRRRLDPRIELMGPEQAWAMIERVAKAGHLSPLTDIAGHAQTSLIVFMAGQALRSPMGLAWSQSRETSTRAPSLESSSPPS